MFAGLSLSSRPAGQLVNIIWAPDYFGFLWLHDCEDKVCSNKHMVGIRGSLSASIYAL